MTISNKNIMPEVFLSESNTSRSVSHMVRQGAARKIGPRLYTRNMSESIDIIVARNRWQVVGMLAPGGVIGYRTALESHPAEDGSVFITCGYKKITDLPGLRIVRLAGSGPTEGDMPFIGGLYMASPARLLLENLSHTKTRESATKAAGQIAVEEKLTSILRIKGENELNRVRDLARSISGEVRLEKEFQLLDRLIGSLLQTREAELKHPVSRSYFSGEPYDPARMEQFEALRSILARTVLPDRNRTYEPGPAFYNESFFDAYFSNFIEGTEFEVDEALSIVFSGVIPQSRPEDAHDILGTWRIVGNLDELRRRPSDVTTFMELLRSRHTSIMEGRPDKRPGEIKEKGNRAGSTYFVAPELVTGTLAQGFVFYNSLGDPLARALFMMYLVSEVHPFDDGNGRTARAMMNAELVAAGVSRIIIPSVYRNEYIASLKLLSNHKDPNAFLRVMDVAQDFVNRIDFSDLTEVRHILERCNAFERPADTVRLMMPK
ncbi:MAG: Fic family protein [Desulfuromonadales bacterium]